MRTLRRITVSSILALASAIAGAQNLTDLKISEIQALNETCLMDEYGERNGWFEVFNTSSGTVKFGGCYLSDDPDDLKKYHIPTTDLSTKVGPRQSVVFHASGKPARGSFHTNFKIANGSTVYLVSNDGKTILDQISLPADLPADWSVKKVPIGIKKLDFKIENSDNPTPGLYNGDVNAKSNSEIMKEKDPHGWVLTLISVMTVFSALIILSIVFGRIGKLSMKAAGNSNKKAGKASAKGGKQGKMTPEIAAAIAMALKQEQGGEVQAAIALALDDYLCNGIHDNESFIITIRRTEGSQWTSKTQNFRQMPQINKTLAHE